jgi:hypothetical protein
MSLAAKLRTRWWLYVAGLWAFAYWPARFEVSTIGHPVALAPLLGGLAVAIAILEALGRSRVASWSVRPREDFDDPLSRVRVLDISGVVPNV